MRSLRLSLVTQVAALALASFMLASPARGETLRAEALVLVNSTSPDYLDFGHFVQPYLDKFGIPYTVLDIVSQAIDPSVDQYAVILVSHRQIDINAIYLSSVEQDYLRSAVESGTGLVNFDNDLATGANVARYSFVQEIFDFQYLGTVTASGITFLEVTSPSVGQPSFGYATTLNRRPPHWGYVGKRHEVGESISTGSMDLAGVLAPSSVMVPAVTGSQPLLALAAKGRGRAVQWGSYDWMSYDVKGPVYGLDDLVWRSIAWAARKPFVMQGLPPMITMRVDDVSGPLWWAEAAVQLGFKPYLSVFPDEFDDAEAAQLSALTNGGRATASIHAWTWNDFFYWNHWSGTDFPNATMQSFFVQGTQWHLDHDIPISKYVMPHFAEMGVNALDGLRDWGVEFVTNLHDLSQPWGSPWLIAGPYRLYAPRQGSDLPIPLSYADFLTVPGRPDLDGEFFVCVTQIRDDAGYEWAPDGDVAASIERGTRQLRRALDGIVLATLFTHEQRVQPIAQEDWCTMLAGIQSNLAPYDPQYVTIDHAGQYVRAAYTSDISSARFDPDSLVLSVALAGETDLPTELLLFTEEGGRVRQEWLDVPVFTGSTVVIHSLPPAELQLRGLQPTATLRGLAPIAPGPSGPRRP